ncbi:unnamed protein product [Aphanomyces euteiches]|uniref:FYVE-type domain-containing protein n=1 Tax=Aphanomyces euteiches TaxID=100861 RepID=A0A6G0WTK0_9STRA|nr:hypothetical protein Ae201684_011822 [Aphanomyces euteiches]KAH9089353.1 hypothetical protein Ae201684P_001553 [Aphanomyces euteiches]KAH9104337.1 hypothetical protein LEN26_015073 [Aphanomyces euteiches]KAH9108616.1 hypothetical protein AeMF1_016215 [Aphanomyces euteiches]KAH9122594.1 hypothetical protein AeMF1_006168 [Aphanomyces euteiches]
MGVKKLFPLPEGFFHAPPISDLERFQYIRQGQKNLLQFVAKARLRGGPIQWTFDHEANGVMVYRGKDLSLPAGRQVVYLNVTEVEATLDEAAAIMSAGEDGTRDYCATYNRDEIVDLKLLYQLAKAVPEHPHNSVTIKWRAFTTNTPMISPRDMVFLEFCDDFTLDNMKGFGRVMTSIELPEIAPDLQKPLGVVRCHMYNGGDVFIQNPKREGYLTAFRLYQQDVKGALPPWIVSRIAKSLVARCHATLELNFRHERVLALEFANELQPDEALAVPKDTRTHCGLCTQGFTAVNRKTNCYKCGEVLCKSCNLTWAIEVGRRIGRNRPVKRYVRVCLVCSANPTLRNGRHSAYTTGTDIEGSSKASRSVVSDRPRRAKSFHK